MKITLSICLLYFLAVFSISAQPFYKSYDWEDNPQYSNKDFAHENIVSLKEKIVSEFYFEEDGSLVEYFLEHKVFYLNSDDKIEDYNKVYLPYASDSKLEVNKARVITASGKIINLDDSKILTAVNKESNKTYKYFAFEGVEKGSFIEYLYVVKRSPVYSGKRIDIQSNFLKKNLELHVYAPNNFLFKFKSYNGLPDVQRDTTIVNKKHWSLQVPLINLLEREELSAYDANRMFIIYALDENTANNSKDISSYAKVAQSVYSIYNVELSKKEQGELIKLLKHIDFKDIDSIESKLRAIEYHIKTNFFITEGNSENLSTLVEIFKNKIANERGIIKLYSAIFNQLNINYESIYTCERDYMRFDEDFEANNFLLDVLFYFPETQKYLSPTEIESRYGYPPAYLTDTYGLFVKEVKIGEFKSAVGKIDYINPIKATETVDRSILEVEFDKEDFSQVIVNMDKSFTGYYGMYIHPYMGMIKPEDKDELIEGIAKQIDEDITIIKKRVENEKPELFGIKPIQFLIEFHSNAFVEKAGRKYLFKVGDLIGQQMELYQEKQRILPVENEFQRSYIRKITITIPEGYKVSNLSDLNIENVYQKDGDELLSFKSFYKILGNKLVITADEHYRINHIPIDIYEEYRKVINSAADFNKVVLVLEPLTD